MDLICRDGGFIGGLVSCLLASLVFCVCCFLCLLLFVFCCGWFGLVDFLVAPTF